MVSAADFGFLGSSPTEGEIQLMSVWHFIAQSFSLLPFHRLDMT